MAIEKSVIETRLRSKDMEESSLAARFGTLVGGAASSVGSFAWRHKKKLAFMGVIVGGAYYAANRAKEALADLPTNPEALQRELAKHLKLSTLLESNGKIVEKHVQGLMGPLKDKLKKLYDVESIKERLKSKELSGTETLKLWDDMKFLCMLTWLPDSNRNRGGENQLTVEDQKKILATADLLLDEGAVAAAGEAVKSVVTPIVNEYDLRRSMDQESIIKLIAKIRIRLEATSDESLDVVRRVVIGGHSKHADPVLKSFFSDMEKFIASQDYSHTLATCLDSCYNKLMQDLADSLLQNEKARSGNNSATPSTQWHLVKIIPCIFSRIHVVLADQSNIYLREMHQLHILEAFNTHLLTSKESGIESPPAV